jgi:hypothetical protein
MAEKYLPGLWRDSPPLSAFIGEGTSPLDSTDALPNVGSEKFYQHNKQFAADLVTEPPFR